MVPDGEGAERLDLPQGRHRLAGFIRWIPGRSLLWFAFDLVRAQGRECQNSSQRAWCGFRAWLPGLHHAGTV